MANETPDETTATEPEKKKNKGKIWLWIAIGAVLAVGGGTGVEFCIQRSQRKAK